MTQVCEAKTDSVIPECKSINLNEAGVGKSTGRAVPQATRRVVVPQAQLQREENGFVLTALLAGVPRENLEIQLEGRFLNLKGRAVEPSWEGYERAYTEFGYVDYECAVRLPQDVDPEQIQASLEQGVLKIQLPKSPTAGPKKIQINA